MTAVARIDYFHTADKKTDIKEHEVYAICNAQKAITGSCCSMRKIKAP